ncbi:MAG TPA: hypothetical protein VIH93_16050 [Thermoanaerobaculia bacterium]|jgi:hypothetical protein
MPFKIRDLMVDIVPGRGVAAPHLTPNIICQPLSHCLGPTHIHCPIFTCPWATLVQCGGGTFWLEASPLTLPALKRELQAQLAQVEEQERAAEAAARPQTREQAQELEEKLQGALDEVRSLKKTLPSAGKK